jgi:hypothetical protein
LPVAGAIANMVGSVVGGIQSRNAAQNAAETQASYAKQAQALELQNQQEGVQFQTAELGQLQAAEQPYQQLGQTASNAYANLINNPFTAPTLAQAQATPGYQFNLQTGTQAINEHAAATGNLLSGNTGVALQNYGQGLATTTYQQAYQNALNQYQTNLGAAAGGTQVGLNSTAQLGQYGQMASNNLANLYLQGGQQQAQQLNNQGTAYAGGDIGSANAWNAMIQNLQNENPYGGGMGAMNAGQNVQFPEQADEGMQSGSGSGADTPGMI